MEQYWHVSFCEYSTERRDQPMVRSTLVDLHPLLWAKKINTDINDLEIAVISFQTVPKELFEQLNK